MKLSYILYTLFKIRFLYAKTTIKIFILLFFIEICCYGQNRWAIVVGISSYPQWQGELPTLSSATSDAQILYNTLTSSVCGFRREQTFLLTNQQAQYKSFQKVLEEITRNSSAQDSLIFFFIGHGIFLQDRYYLLLQDSNPSSLLQTAIPLDYLAEWLEKVPCRKIFVALDSQRSTKSVGYSWKSHIAWGLQLSAQKQFAFLYASHPYHIAKERGGIGLFTYFTRRALSGSWYLNQNPDINQDGYITVTEFMQYMQQSLRFSGLGQSPFFWGQNSCVLSSPIFEKPKIILRPQLTIPILENSSHLIEVSLSGILYFHHPVESFLINGQKIDFRSVPAPTEVAIELSRYCYKWEIKANFLPLQEYFEAIVQIQQGKTHYVLVNLPWIEKGWYGEWMPPGLQRSTVFGVYYWKKDQSEMIYIPEGMAILGIPHHQSSTFTEDIQELQNYFDQMKIWYEQDYEFRQLLIRGIEESNQTIQRLAHRIQSLYQKTNILDNVQRRISAQKDIRPPTLESSEENYVSQSQEVLNRAQQDVSRLMQQQKEIEQILEYFSIIMQNPEKYLEYCKGKVVSMNGFYMDRYEISNLQYRTFCEETSRPYPASAFWDEDYIFKDESPVVAVSWEDAMAYNLWVGKKLPTEEQWEKAARTEQGHLYPWGDQPPDLSCANANIPPPLELVESKESFKSPIFQPISVRKMPQGKQGFYNLIGNVQEWCRNTAWLDNLDVEMKLPGQEYRVTKGGSYQSSGILLATWFHQAFISQTRRYDLGFRGVIEK